MEIYICHLNFQMAAKKYMRNLRAELKGWDERATS